MAAGAVDRRALINDFLQALSSQGIAIGPREIDRLRHLFARQPALDRHRLKTLLRAVLLKKPSQRDIFDALFDDWCPDQDADWRLASLQVVETEQAPPPAKFQQEQADKISPLPWWRSKRLQGCVGLAAVALVVALVWPWLFPPEVIPEPKPPIKEKESHAPQQLEQTDELPSTPVDRVWYWRAEIDNDAIVTPARLDPPRLVLLALTALGIVFICCCVTGAGSLA